jgi:large subunit ribosomal protein L24
MRGIESSKPKKQRKAHYGRDLRGKQQGLAGHLDKKLGKELGTRSIALRKGDSVKVMRGGFKGKNGKITGVDYKKGVVFVEKVMRKKANGEEVQVPLQASKLLVVELEKSDSKRFKAKKAQASGKKESGKKPGEENEVR